MASEPPNKEQPLTEEQKSQVCEPEPAPSKERRLLDLRYLREEIEAEEARKSQIIPKQSS